MLAQPCFAGPDVDLGNLKALAARRAPAAA
jgi:hypothetical protein